MDGQRRNEKLSRTQREKSKEDQNALGRTISQPGSSAHWKIFFYRFKSIMLVNFWSFWTLLVKEGGVKSW